MYLEFFGLRELPFSLAPDPRFLYLSAQHREALAHLLYGLRSEGGFVQLTGEIGTGKTTVCRCFLEQLPPETRAAVVLNPRLGAEELLEAVCDEFEIPRPEAGRATVKAYLDAINRFLLEEHAQGRRAVLVIDEAQNLDPAVLEQLRLLTNLETSRHKLLQIILMGQPELRATLARPELLQLAQRITARFHLGPLSREEAASYVRHRLEVAGCPDPVFPPAALRLLHRLGGGVPRRMNILADRALLGTFVQGRREVDARTLRQAAREVAGGSARPAAVLRRAAPAALAVAAAAALLGAILLRERPPAQAPAAAPSPAASRIRYDVAAAPEGFTESAAFGSLFGLWGLAYLPGEGQPCAQAIVQGVGCYHGEGGIEEIRRLDRPAVLALSDAAGNRRHVAVAGAGADGRWKLASGGGTVTVDAAWFQPWTPGGFTLLWRMPPSSRGAVTQGERGPAVAWLERRLARALGRAREPRAEAVYDERTAEDVRAFQRAAGMTADGVAGPRTLILLDREPDPGTPTLASAAR